ncbi:hypothetical protein INR49_008771 [Caranx melampygus]|nr:hypothetical protein INR49_008771 [Caranx melampygus]
MRGAVFTCKLRQRGGQGAAIRHLCEECLCCRARAPPGDRSGRTPPGRIVRHVPVWVGDATV